MSVSNFDELRNHIGHNIRVVGYGDKDETGAMIMLSVAVECEECKEVLFDFDAPPYRKTIKTGRKMKLTIKNFKDVMIEKADKKGGIWENFGQDEIVKLKEKYGYNPLGTQAERDICYSINKLDDWAQNYCG